MKLRRERARIVLRVCHHFIHSSCAEKLNPRKCPLCRRSFAELSIPLDENWLLSTPPEEIIRGLRRLDGLPHRTSEQVEAVPTQSVIALLAATLPIPEELLCSSLQAGSLLDFWASD
eukprot:Skav218240  [mRNA]  locus=scaffold4566:215272:217260:+ [translate_table: standard]